MSPSVARINGPGTVPLYVQAGKKTPGRSRSPCRSPAACTRALGRARRAEPEAGCERVDAPWAADSGNLGADHGGVTRRRVVLHVPLQVPVGRLGVAVQGELPETGAAASGAAAARRRPRVSFDLDKTKSILQLDSTSCHFRI